MNILLSCNKNHFYPLQITLYSLYKTQSEKINLFFIKSKNLENENILFLKDLCKQYSFNFYEVALPEVLYQKLYALERDFRQLFNNIGTSIESYFRIFCIPYLPPQRFLWIDTDCLIRKDLKDFYNKDFLEKSIIACDSRDVKYNKEKAFSKEISPGNSREFNAGVMLLNVEKLQKFNILKKEYHDLLILFIKTFQGNKLLRYGDQILLNIFLQFDIYYEDPLLYNCSPYQKFEGGLGERAAIYNYINYAYILHYAGPNKPWKEDSKLTYIQKKPWLDIEKEYLNFLRLKNNES